MAKKKLNGGFKVLMSTGVVAVIGWLIITLYSNLDAKIDTKSDKAVCDTRYEHTEEHHRESKAERQEILRLIREIKGDIH